MDPLTAPSRSAISTAALAWTLLAAAAIVAMLASPNLWRFPALLLPAIVFLVGPLLVPSFVPRSPDYLSPHVWALVLLFGCLVGVPVLIAWLGPAQGTLPTLPDDAAIGAALCLQTAVLVAFLAGLLAGGGAAAADTGAPRRGSGGLSSREIIVFAALGATGLWLTFGDVAALGRFLANPAGYAESVTLPPLEKGLGLVSRPFLIVAAVAWWSGRVVRRPSTGLRLLELAVAMTVILVVGVTYNFNRATFAVPVLALASAYSSWIRRLPLAVLAVAGVVGASLLLAVGAFRSAGVSVPELLHRPEVATRLGEEIRPLDQVQIYGGAPQFTAFLLKANALSRGGAGGTLAGSLLSPVPVLGKPFRATSGPAVYNRMVYGTSTISDQLIPFPGELLINAGPVATLAVFVLLGWIIRQLDRVHAAAANPLDAYLAFYVAAWLLYLVPGSLLSVSQTVIYFFWPIYACVLLERSHRRRRLAGATGGG